MTTKPLACPYCNTLVPPPDEGRNDSFLACPRCGERVRYRRSDLGEMAHADLNVGAPIGKTSTSPARWSNRTLALGVLGVMVFMAAGGLTLALLTRSYRRSHDLPRASQVDAERVRVVAPVELASLGYLPADTDAIVGLHVAEALQDPAGRGLLRRFLSQEPWRSGREQAPARTDSLEQWTGLGPDEIDHAVLGLNLTNRLIPRLTLVVQTRQSYDPEKVRTALRASRSPEPGRKLYRFKLEKPPLDAVLWFAGERTLIVALSAEDFQGVPATPHIGVAHLSAPLRQMLEERLGGAAPIWAVGHADDWDRTTAKLLLGGLAKEDARLLEKVKAFGVWLQLGQGLTINGSFHCTDATAGKALERYLTPAEGTARRSINLWGSLPDAAPLARELGQSLKVVCEDDWVTLQAKASTTAVQQALGREHKHE